MLRVGWLLCTAFTIPVWIPRSCDCAFGRRAPEARWGVCVQCGCPLEDWGPWFLSLLRVVVCSSTGFLAPVRVGADFIQDGGDNMGKVLSARAALRVSLCGEARLAT